MKFSQLNLKNTSKIIPNNLKRLLSDKDHNLLPCFYRKHGASAADLSNGRVQSRWNHSSTRPLYISNISSLIHQNKALELLNNDRYPIGSLPPKICQEAAFTLWQLAKFQNVESLEISFDLIYRLIEEQERKKQNHSISITKSVITPKLLNFIIKNLCECWRRGDKTNLDPAKVLSRIERLEPNTQTFNIIINNSYYRDRSSKITFIALALNKMKTMSDLGNNEVKFDESFYIKLINAYANVDKAANSEVILKSMYDAYMKGNTKIQPNVHVFNTVLSAWSRSKAANAPERAEALLKSTRELYKRGALGIKPDKISHTSVLNCWAKSGREYVNAGERAETMLDEMNQMAFAGDEQMRPDTMSYSAVINAYACIGNADKAEKIFKTMYHAYNNGIKNAKPDVLALNMVLTAWSRSKATNAPERAEAIIKSLNYQESRNMLFIKPDIVSYSTILHCWAKSGRKNAGDRAEAILREVERLDCAGYEKMKPNTVFYNSLINIYAKAGNVDRAEFILKEMYDRYLNGNIYIKPDIQSFNTVLDGWSKSKAANAPERAETTLEQMVDLAEANRLLDIKPDVVSSNIVMNCWAKSRRVDSGLRAEAILRKLENAYTAGRKEMRPDIISYSTVINAYASVGNADQAERILKEMYSAYNHNNTNVKPNTQTVTAVLFAWSRSKNPDAPERAEAILKHMHDLGSEHNLYLQPDIMAYNAVLHCWAKSSRKESGIRSEAILREMVRQFVQPNTASYNILINTHAKVGNAERAEMISMNMYDMFMNDISKAKPDIFTFNSVLTAWSRSKTPNAPERAESILKHMKELTNAGVLEVKPDALSYASVINCWAKSGRLNSGERAEAVHQEMRHVALSSEVQAKHIKIFYSSIINANCRIGNAAKAEMILKDMYIEYTKGNNDVKPSFQIFTNVLMAWCRSKCTDAPKRAEALLKTMWSLSKKGILDVMPTVASYNAVIHCWINRKQQYSAKKVESVLCFMKDVGYKPQTVLYNAVISAYIRDGKVNDAERIFKEMYCTTYIDGNIHLEPNRETFNLIFGVLLNSHTAEAPERAKALLEYIRKQYNKGKWDSELKKIMYNIKEPREKIITSILPNRNIT